MLLIHILLICCQTLGLFLLLAIMNNSAMNKCTSNYLGPCFHLLNLYIGMQLLDHKAILCQILFFCKINRYFMPTIKDKGEKSNTNNIKNEKSYNTRYKRKKNNYKITLHTTLWQPTWKSRENCWITRKIQIDTERNRKFKKIIYHRKD